MDRQYLLQLLKKYNKGELTAAERKYVENYYNLFEAEPDLFSIMSKEEKEKIAIELRDRLTKKIENRQGSVKQVYPTKISFQKIAVAAVLTSLFVGLSFIYYVPLKKQVSKLFYTKKSLLQDSLKQQKVIASYHQNENRFVVLPDGSEVVLGPNSNLNYPSSFDDKPQREVFLDGLAFFDIKHNPAKPFIVHAGKITTKVLGTAFNVKAIPGEQEITVTVTRGKVSVANEYKNFGVILPNQQIVYDKIKVSAVLKKVNSSNYLEWKEQNLFVDNLTLYEVSKILEERHHVKIIINDPEIKNLRFSTTLTKDGKIDEELKSISLFNGVEVEYNQDQSITISKSLSNQ